MYILILRGFSNYLDNKMELIVLFEKYQSNLSVYSNGLQLEFSHFQKFILEIIPSWGKDADILERFWKLLHTSTKFVDFNELTQHLSQLQKGTLQQQLQCSP